MEQDNKKKIKILTSWDDAGQSDMILADMLIRYKIPSVFYIPSPDYALLSRTDIKKLGGAYDCDLCNKTKTLFDIGAHTMTHPQDLKKLNYTDLTYEINESKKYLEELIKRPVTKFCYPRGRFDTRVKYYVKQAGFTEARTTRVLNTDFPEDPLETDTSVHVHPERKEYNGMTWHETAVLLFDKVLREGGRFELWGHSFEIYEKYHQEEFLDDFLSYMDDEMRKIKYPRDISIEYYKK
jgi:peptidoglycan-N-acetylglucosamine deacetylase